MSAAHSAMRCAALTPHQAVVATPAGPMSCNPTLSLLQQSGMGFVVSGREAIEALRCMCDVALGKQDASSSLAGGPDE